MAEVGIDEAIAAEFARVSGAAGFSDALANTARQLEGVRAVSQVLVEAVGANTSAVAQSTSAAGVVKGVAAEAGKSVLKNFTLAPVFSSLFKLFGGGSQPEPTPLVKYAAPAAVSIEAAYLARERSVVSADVGQDGRTRPAWGAAPQITVQVQALDSRSFMDRSGEIAEAVRDAMLNMHAINDVVNDL